MTAQHDQNAGPDPYTSPKTFYGSELRRLREAAGMSQTELGERCFCSGTYIGQFEAAVRRPQPDLSRMFDEVFGTGRHMQRLCELARKSKYADYFADAAELEKLALTISEYTPMLVPGLLQTEAYARALARTTMPFATDEEIDRNVAARIERQKILQGPTALLLWEIIHEAALMVPVGGPQVMREQLEHILQVVEKLQVVVQVHPLEAGPHIFMNGLVSLMTFHDAPPVAYVEAPYTGQLLDESPVVGRYQSAYDLARAVALPLEASLDRIASMAEDFAKHEHHT
ncbi:Scr1 family TA system antitoxin-like transcriptional regulator [Streptomyces sp. NPDC088745]|uniref:helix-turn-helix domain-containing protein n=1 Tax=Streptomyces sp. NPDC088745 TaxID=3365884 RepID=UPI0038037300